MDSKQIIIFSLEQDEYGVDITYVQEIIRIPEQIIKLPDTPAYMEGLVNLRGKVIPVMDFKKRFGFASSERGNDSRLLILSVDRLQMGVIVDDVSEVVQIGTDQMEELGTSLRGTGSSIETICKVGNRLILLVNAGKMKEEFFQYMEGGRTK